MQICVQIYTNIFMIQGVTISEDIHYIARRVSEDIHYKIMDIFSTKYVSFPCIMNLFMMHGKPTGVLND